MPATTLPHLLTVVLIIGLVGLGGTLVVGQALDQPVVVSYVTTGSMAPTLDPGDGFVAVPTALVGSIQTGDVVVFRAKSVGGGGLTTHRVVGETNRGYLTQGDANTVTDQSGTEPLVVDPQIVAVALQIDDRVVAIPFLGTAVETVRETIVGLQRRLATTVGLGTVLVGTRGLVYTLFALSLLWSAADAVRGTSRRRERSRSRDTGTSTRLVLGVIVLVVTASATAAMVLPAGPYAFDVVSSAVGSERPGVLERGETGPATYVVRNGGIVPVVVFLTAASDGVAVPKGGFEVGGRSFTEVTVGLTAPPETGAYSLYLVEYRYLAVLPESVLTALFAVHPWLPILAVNALLGVPLYVIGYRLIGTDRIRVRSRTGPSRVRRSAARLAWFLR